MNETQGKSIVQHLSLPALPYDIYASSSPLPPSSHPLSHSLKLRDGISPPLTTHIPLAISDVPEVAQRRRHNDHVHGGEEGGAPRPAEVLVAVHHHVVPFYDSGILVESFVSAGHCTGLLFPGKSGKYVQGAGATRIDTMYKEATPHSLFLLLCIAAHVELTLPSGRYTSTPILSATSLKE